MKKFLKGALLGSLASGVAAILLNPRRGVENKQRIRQKINDLQTEATDFKNEWTHAHQNATNIREQKETLDNLFQHELPPFVQGVKKDIREFTFQISPRTQQIKEQIEKIKGHFH